MVLQRSYGGEDAHFVSDIGGGALGIADGVGGWVRDGINPAGGSMQVTHASSAPAMSHERAAAMHMTSPAAWQLHCSNAGGLPHLRPQVAGRSCACTLPRGELCFVCQVLSCDAILLSSG